MITYFDPVLLQCDSLRITIHRFFTKFAQMTWQPTLRDNRFINFSTFQIFERNDFCPLRREREISPLFHSLLATRSITDIPWEENRACKHCHACRVNRRDQFSYNPQTFTLRNWYRVVYLFALYASSLTTL